MKRYSMILVLIVALLSVSLSASAQHRRGNRQGNEQVSREQLAQRQANYIAQELALEPEKSQLFITTYMNCQKEIWALGPRQNCGNRNEIDNEQADSVIQARFDYNQKVLDIRRKYYAEYSKFLTAKQIEQMYRIEQRMMGNLREHHRRGSRNGNRTNNTNNNNN